MRMLVVTVTMLFSVTVLAQSIRYTDHDLSSSSVANLKNQASNNQICIYCHTPHQATSTQFLWNRSPSANTSWTWGNDLDNNAPMTATTSGTKLPTTLRSASVRCLSCHDGSVAIGDVANAGNGNTTTVTGLASIAGLTDGTGKLIDSAKLVGSGGDMGGAHPVSIPYAGQTAYNGINSSVPASWLGGAAGGYWDVSTSGCQSTTGVCTTAPASDGMNGANINLIPNISGSTTNVGVECTSCHEPHNKYGYAWFLRVDVTNASGLCRSCHNK